MEIILEKAKKQFGQNLPFVIYKKPNEVKIIGLFQKNDNLFEVNHFTEKGFVFASFDGSQQYIIPESASEHCSEDWIANSETIPQNEVDFGNDTSAQASFQNLVSKGIQAIHNSEFQKVVVSRKESVALEHFDLGTTFKKLV